MVVTSFFWKNTLLLSFSNGLAWFQNRFNGATILQNSILCNWLFMKKTFSKGFITDYACSQKKMVKNVAFKEGARDRECAKVAHTLWLLVWKIIARCAPIFKPSKPLALWNYYSGLKRKKGQRVGGCKKMHWSRLSSNSLCRHSAVY